MQSHRSSRVMLQLFKLPCFSVTAAHCLPFYAKWACFRELKIRILNLRFRKEFEFVCNSKLDVSKVETLSLMNFRDDFVEDKVMIVSLLNACRSLTSLEFRGSQSFVDETIELVDEHIFSNLTTFISPELVPNFTGISFNKITRNWCNLLHLNLSCYGKYYDFKNASVSSVISDDMVAGILRHNPNLLSLKLSNSVEKMTIGNLLSVLTESCRNLVNCRIMHDKTILSWRIN